MIRALFGSLYRNVPPVMWVLLGLELFAASQIPTGPIIWGLLWHQTGFVVMMGLVSRKPESISGFGLLFWVFREAMFWPEVVYRFCKARAE